MYAEGQEAKWQEGRRQMLMKEIGPTLRDKTRPAETGRSRCAKRRDEKAR
jgi:hypothetical protein